VDKRAFARACASVNIDVSHTAGALVMGSVSNPRIYSMVAKICSVPLNALRWAGCSVIQQPPAASGISVDCVLVLRRLRRFQRRCSFLWTGGTQMALADNRDSREAS